MELNSKQEAVNISAELILNNNPISNVADPTDPQQVATKSYVDSIAPIPIYLQY